MECTVCATTKTAISMVANIDSDYCCFECAEAHNGPGKFEVYSWNTTGGDSATAEDLESLGKCLILDTWANDGNEDDYMSAEGWGYCGRFDNYLLYHDEQGFITYDEFDTVADAEKEFDKLYKTGMGAYRLLP